MSLQTASPVNTAERIDIPARTAISVNVARGAAIQCVSGNVWLTQEGDLRDYTLPAGVTFCTDREGQAVLSAIEEPSSVIVCASCAGRPDCVPGTVRIDSIAELTHRARAEQSAYVARVLTQMAATVVTAIRRLRAVLQRRPKIQGAC